MRKRTSSSRVSEEEAMELLFSKDSDLPKEILEPLCTAIGALVLLWGAVEMSLHLLVVTAFDDAGGKEIEDEFPRALARKIKFLRKSFRHLGPLKPFAKECLSLLELTAELGTKRHGVIHAAATGFDVDTGRVDFTGLDADKTGHLVKIVRYSVLELNELCLVSAELAGRLSEIGSRIHEAVTREDQFENDTGPLRDKPVRSLPFGKKGSDTFLKFVKRILTRIRIH